MNPCRYCEPPNRYPGCHSKCEAYLKFHKENEFRREHLNKVHQEEREYRAARFKHFDNHKVREC